MLRRLKSLLPQQGVEAFLKNKDTVGLARHLEEHVGAIAWPPTHGLLGRYPTSYLFLCLDQNHPEAVELLLRAGLSPNDSNQYQRPYPSNPKHHGNALGLALDTHNLEMSLAFVKAGIPLINHYSAKHQLAENQYNDVATHSKGIEFLTALVLRLYTERKNTCQVAATQILSYLILSQPLEKLPLGDMCVQYECITNELEPKSRNLRPIREFLKTIAATKLQIEIAKAVRRKEITR